MRRKDREVTDSQAIDAIIEACDCCRLGINDGGVPYIVPLNFAFEKEEGKRVFYFHGAKKGRKMELLAGEPRVGFEMDTDHQVVPAQGDACRYSFRFQSIIGTGRVEMVEDPREKTLALERIFRHYAQEGEERAIPPQAVEATAVFRLVVEELGCKQHL